MVNGEEIKRRREQRNMSQSEAGELAGMTAQRWSDFERGRYPDPRVGTLWQIAKALGCKVDQLLNLESNRNPGGGKSAALKRKRTG